MAKPHTIAPRAARSAGPDARLFSLLRRWRRLSAQYDGLFAQQIAMEMATGAPAAILEKLVVRQADVRLFPGLDREPGQHHNLEWLRDLNASFARPKGQRLAFSLASTRGRLARLREILTAFEEKRQAEAGKTLSPEHPAIMSAIAKIIPKVRKLRGHIAATRAATGAGALAKIQFLAAILTLEDIEDQIETGTESDGTVDDDIVLLSALRDLVKLGMPLRQARTPTPRRQPLRG